MRQVQARGIIVAAPRSGAGKTTIALGLMRALSRRGHVVQPYKCGPDYIDPAFHAAAAGRASYNLDPWAMRPRLIEELTAAHADCADIAIAEGVMGLFDGTAEEGQSGRGSTADLAALTGWPVILVLDVSRQAETAAAVALGCATYRADISVAGVILNRVASPRHAGIIVPAIERLGLAVIGVVARDQEMALSERHLGLVQAAETCTLEAKLDKIADTVEKGVDIDKVAALASVRRRARKGDDALPRLGPPGQRVALAQDRAFSFTYPHLLEGWRSAGAEIKPFSPLADEGPDPSADAVWLPGGYPELHAGTLSGAANFHAGLRSLARCAIPIHGECGGYMVLGAGLEDAEGRRHAMTGLLGVEASFKERKLHLGYRRVRLLADSALGKAGDVLFGHEFHYASLVNGGDDALVASLDAPGALPETGARRGSVSGTFFHVIDRAV